MSVTQEVKTELISKFQNGISLKPLKLHFKSNKLRHRHLGKKTSRAGL